MVSNTSPVLFRSDEENDGHKKLLDLRALLGEVSRPVTLLGDDLEPVRVFNVRR